MTNRAVELVKNLTGARIALIGPPGAGKEEQSKRLNEYLGIESVTVSSVLRAAVSADRNDERSEYIAWCLEQGELVGDDIVCCLMFRKFSGAGHSVAVINGFPRTEPQALGFLGLPGTSKIAIFISVPAEECKLRLLYGANGKGRGRQDDTPEIIERRLVDYSRHERKIKRVLGGKATILDINGNQPAHVVCHDIILGLRNFTKTQEVISA